MIILMLMIPQRHSPHSKVLSILHFQVWRIWHLRAARHHIHLRVTESLKSHKKRYFSKIKKKPSISLVFSNIRKWPTSLDCQQLRFKPSIVCGSICGETANVKRLYIYIFLSTQKKTHNKTLPVPSAHYRLLTTPLHYLFEPKLTWQKLHGFGNTS